MAVAESGPDGWLSLEGGIEIQFTGNLFRTGDYWLIPARTVTGNIDWPFTDPQPPLGIKHCYARLAVLQHNPKDDSLSTQDWRRRFSPLAEAAPALRIVGINWLNDDTVTLPQLKTDGLQIVLDGAPAPIVRSDGSNVMVVKLEVPVLLAAGTTPPRPDLAFPSGVGTYASDFHSWFYLFAEIPQPGLASTAGIREGAPRFGRQAHRGYGSLRATAPSAGSVGRV